ncbi:hypothetical protein [Thauera mechernichensis]
MKQISVLAFAAFLTACASPMSPKQLVNAGPLSTYVSTKGSGLVAKCIAARWEESKTYVQPPIISVRETELGHRVIFYVHTDVKYVVDVDNASSGSRSKLFIGNVVSFGADEQIKGVSECQ